MRTVDCLGSPIWNPHIATNSHLHRLKRVMKDVIVEQCNTNECLLYPQTSEEKTTAVLAMNAQYTQSPSNQLKMKASWAHLWIIICRGHRCFSLGCICRALPGRKCILLPTGVAPAAWMMIKLSVKLFRIITGRGWLMPSWKVYRDLLSSRLWYTCLFGWKNHFDMKVARYVTLL